MNTENAMIRKFYEGKQNKSDSVLLWGSGTPLREFLHVDDLAQAIIIKLLSETTLWLIVKFT